MHNSSILKLWVQENLTKLDRDLVSVDRYEDALKIQGKIEILKEFYEDFNLEEVQDKDIIYHKNV
jgi:hypothetical protein